MLRAYRSALVGLRRRSIVLATIGGSALFALIATALRFTTAGGVAVNAGGPGPETVTLASLAAPGGIVSGLENATTFLGVLAVAIGALCVAGDYGSGVIRTLLVRQPRREVVLAGKLLAILGLLLRAALAATLVSTATALVVAGGQGVDTGAWSAWEIVPAFARTALVLGGYGLLGALLGLLLRSPAPAIGVGIAWVFAFEQLLSGAWDGASDVLPGLLLGQVAEGGAGLGQGLALGLYLLAALVLGRAVVMRRDVTA